MGILNQIRDPYAARRNERIAAEAEKLKAQMEYLAVMCDCEEILEEDETESEVSEDE